MSLKNKDASIPPISSDKADIKTNIKTFLWLLVEWYIGIAIDNPSGILWRAIPKASVIPRLKLESDEIKVIIPSGILWRIRAISEVIPTLYKELEVCLEIRLSKNLEIITPIFINNKTEIILLIEEKDSGISEKIDKVIIEPALKDKEKLINLSLFTFLM